MASGRPFSQICLAQCGDTDPRQPCHVYAETKALAFLLRFYSRRPQHVRFGRAKVETVACGIQRGFQRGPRSIALFHASLTKSESTAMHYELSLDTMPYLSRRHDLTIHGRCPRKVNIMVRVPPFSRRNLVSHVSEEGYLGAQRIHNTLADCMLSQIQCHQVNAKTDPRNSLNGAGRAVYWSTDRNLEKVLGASSTRDPTSTSSNRTGEGPTQSSTLVVEAYPPKDAKSGPKSSAPKFGHSPSARFASLCWRATNRPIAQYASNTEAKTHLNKEAVDKPSVTSYVTEKKEQVRKVDGKVR